MLKYVTFVSVCPDMGVIHYAAVGHFATEYGILNVTK
jgi:hypothetical protein